MKKNLFLLTLLLSQAVSTHAIAIWNEADEETTRVAAHDRFQTHTLFKRPRDFLSVHSAYLESCESQDTSLSRRVGAPEAQGGNSTMMD